MLGVILTWKLLVHEPGKETHQHRLHGHSFFTGMLANVSLWLLQTMYQICYTGNKKQVQNNQCAFIYQRSLTYFFSSGGCALLILSVFSERRSTRSQSFRFTKPRKESVRRQPELHWWTLIVDLLRFPHSAAMRTGGGRAAQLWMHIVVEEIFKSFI